jgi:hypothetical protein
VKGVLNLFQATMLRWREMHPYNAVHAVAIDPRLTPDRLEAAIGATLEHWGLTGLVLDRRRGRYEYRGGPATVRLARVPGSAMLETLEREVEYQLNMPFTTEGALDPFRFFHVTGRDGAMLGLAYDHFIAGGDCILTLLHAIVEACRGAPPGEPPPLYPPTQRALYRANWRHTLTGIGRVPALVRSARRTVRPRYRDPRDGHNGYRLFELPRELSRRLLAAHKAWSVTVNDVLMALLLLAVDPLVPGRRTAQRRVALAVASIMNLRAQYGAQERASFGQFLGSLRVAHPVPVSATLEELARDVHAETELVKRDKVFLQTLLAMGYVKRVWPMLDERQRATFYAKTYPINAGISALNVDALWPRANDGAPTPVYIRGVPTGPLTPLVVAFTTVGDKLYAGVSYRTTACSRDDIDQFWTGLVRRLDTLP